MTPRHYLWASPTARSSRLLLDSPHYSSGDRGAIGDVAQSLKRLVALGMALILLVPMEPGELSAQQAPSAPPLGRSPSASEARDG